MTIKRRLITGMAWMFTASWSEQAINFIVFIILARLLGVEVFGLATMTVVFVLFAEFMVRQTIAETVIQLDGLEDGHLDAIFWLLGALSIVIVVSLILLADLIANLYSEPRIADYLVWASSTVLIIGFSGVPVSILKRKLKFRALAIRATCGALVGGVVGIVLALLDFGVWSFVFQRIVQIAVDHTMAWLSQSWFPGLRATRRHFKEVVGFSSQMVGFRMAEMISVNTPMVVIGAYLGPTMLGQYAIAWRLVEVLTFLLITPVQLVAQPAFAHLNRAKEKVGELLAKVASTSAIITFVSFLGMAVVSGPMIELLFGAEWTAAVPVHQVLCLVGIYLSIEKLQQAFCLALGKARSLLYISLVEAFIGIIAMVAFVDYGITAVAIAFAARYYLMWPFRFNVVTRYTGMTPMLFIKVFTPPLINAIVMTIIILAWQQWVVPGSSGVVLLVSSILVGVLVYAALVWFTMRNQIRELITGIQSL